MSHILFTPYADDSSTFTAAAMNAPLEKFEEALLYVKNIIITCDGEVTANSITGNLSFTGALRVIFTSPIDGNYVENTVESALVKMELGSAVYLDLNGVNGVTIAMQPVKLSGVATVKSNRILLAYRNSVSGEIYLTNMLSKPSGGTTQIAERTVALAPGVTAALGDILCIQPSGKYALADNGAIETTQDLVMVKSVGVEGATVIETGLMNAPEAAFMVSAPLYLGSGGKYSHEAPAESGKIVKCVGYAVEARILKFKPDSFGIKLI